MNPTYPFLKVLMFLIVSGCGITTANQKKVLPDAAAPIGTQQYIWEDTSRVDDYYGGTRKINVQVWYPGDKTASEKIRTPYLLFGDQLYQKLEGWTSSDIEKVQKIITTSFVDIPIMENLNEPPLLIFSPSLGGNLSYYTYYAEYFVKQGYVVMGINHLYESEAIVGKENSIYPGNFLFHDSLKTLQIPEEITADEYRAVKGIRQKVLAEDIRFALDQLVKETEIGSKIDQTKIGAFGHSIGGAAAVYASLLDPRIKVVINLDGTPPTVALNNGIDVPFLFIEDLTDYKNHQGYAKLHQRRNDFCTLNRADSRRVLIKGFNHNSFLDTNFYLARNAATANAAQADLDLILFHIDEFLRYYLLGKRDLKLSPADSEKVEILQFDK